MKVMYRVMTLIVLGFGFAVGSSFAYAQAAPNRALSIPGQKAVPSYVPVAPIFPAVSAPPAPPPPAAAPAAFSAYGDNPQCSDLLERQKELTALLKKKIEILEQRLALTGDQKK